MKRWKHGSMIGVMAVLVACSSSVPLSRRDNLAYIYGKGSAQMPLLARVHHLGDERSRIYFKLNTADLLYKSDGTGGPFHAKVRVHYEAYDSFGAKAPLDSASTLIDDPSPEPTEEKDLIGSMDLRHAHQRPFILKVVAHDLNRDLESAVFLRVERAAGLTDQHFMPVDTSHGLPYFTDHFKGGTVRVRCEVCTGKELIVRHHPARTALPAPVFASVAPMDPAINAPADSTFRVSVDANGQFKLDLARPGAYRVFSDTSAVPAYSLYSVTEAYPIVTSTDDLLKPLRYITSNQEYDRILRSDDVRKAIERFWIDAAGDRERGREAIRIYYGRVENANRHFTSEVEGWRTDRGLVHIIFGVPTSIYKTDLGETWIYGEENNLMSLVFNFKRRDGSTDMNDLVLERDPLLKGAWYRNVESWRNGRVYQN